MTHLNDTELVECLYQDFDETVEHAHQKHLDACQECQSRLEQLRQVIGCLNHEEGSLATESKVHLPPAKNWMPEQKRHPISGASRRDRRWVTTLAGALLVGLAAFFAGGWWNSQQVARQRGPQDWEQVVRQLEQSVQADSQQRWESLQGIVDQRLQQFETALDEVHQASRASGQQWQQIESALVQLADHHALLRKELETLAVSAESAILSTKRDIRNLNQLAMTLGGITP